LKSRTWLRIATGLLAFFAIIHTLGTLSTNGQARGAEKLIDAMRNFHFNAMGSDRTAWDFFRGLGLLFSANLAILAALFVAAGNLSEADPLLARPIVVTLLAANVLLAALSCIYFFLAPIAISGLKVVCLAAAALALNRGRPAS
jgi:hypothetical protein